MLSIIQLVTPPWAALPDREPAHWSSAVGESQAGGGDEAAMLHKAQ